MDSTGPIMKKYFGGKYNLDDETDRLAVMNIIKGKGKKRNRMESLENYMLEYHFAANKVVNREKFERALSKMQNTKLAEDSIYDNSTKCIVNELCKNLDSLKLHYMGKPLDEIRYADYLSLYQ
jgi:hypothetical protein